MIGDADVLPAALFRGFGHFLDRCTAIRVGGVAVKCALDVFAHQKLGKTSCCRSFDLSESLTKLGRYVVECERVEKLSFRTGLQVSSFRIDQLRFSDFEATHFRERSELDYVIGASGC